MSGRLRGLLAWLDWKINPVLLRDLRLFMRGRLMLAGYFLTLSALVLLAVLYAIAAGADGGGGRGLLSRLTMLLLVVCGALIPNFVQERFRGELANRATELALMSPLTPGRLVRGKLMGAWALSLAALSVSAPMLATAYLLGGIGPEMLLGSVGAIISAAAIMPALLLFFAGDGVGGGLARIWNGLVFLGATALMLAYAPFVDSALGGSHLGEELRIVWLAFLAAGILYAQFFYFLIVSRLRGAAEERMIAPRLSLAAAAVLGFVAAFLTAYRLDASGKHVDPEKMFSAAFVIVSWAFCLGFLALIHGGEGEERRPAGFWRGKPLRRFFLRPGIASLTAYFLLCLAPFLAFAVLGGKFGFHSREFHATLCLGLAPAMALAYGLLAYRYIARPISGGKTSARTLFLVTLLTNAALVIVSIFLIVMGRFIDGVDKGFLLCFQPLGLLAAAFDPIGSEAAAGGTLVMAALWLLLAPAALLRPKADKDDSNAPR